MNPCPFYADGEHAWEVGFERVVSEGWPPGWATLEAEHLASDFSFTAAKRCRCGTVVSYMSQRGGEPVEPRDDLQRLARALRVIMRSHAGNNVTTTDLANAYGTLREIAGEPR